MHDVEGARQGEAGGVRGHRGDKIDRRPAVEPPSGDQSNDHDKAGRQRYQAQRRVHETERRQAKHRCVPFLSAVRHDR